MKVYVCFEKLKSYEGDGGEVVKVVTTEELADQWSCEQLPSDVDWRGWEVYEVDEGSAEDSDDDCCYHCSGTGEGAYGDTSCYVCRGRGY